MSKEQIRELAEINATYMFDKVTKLYGNCADEYVRHFYNKLAELRGGIDDVHTCHCQHNSNSRDNELCCRCDSRETNSDRIRNMSDEELADFLDSVGKDGISSQYIPPCDYCCHKECDICWKKWLQSEAE